MMVGGVVGNEVEDQAKSTAMCLLKQSIEVFHGAEDRIDTAVVGNIVSEVGHGGGIDRRDPDGVDAKLNQIVKTIVDSVQITDAITITVLKRSRVDLVNDGVLPPTLILHPTYYSPASVRG